MERVHPRRGPTPDRPRSTDTTRRGRDDRAESRRKPLLERTRSTGSRACAIDFDSGRSASYARVEGVIGEERVVAVIRLDATLTGHPSLVRRVAEREPTLGNGQMDPLERTLAAVRSVERVTRLEIVRASHRMGLGGLRAVAAADLPRRTAQGEGSAPQRFGLHVGEEDGGSVVVLGGELDLSDADFVRDEIAAIHHGDVVVDLAELTFLDAAGLSAILTARRAVTGRGDRFLIRGATRMVRRVFEVTDLGHLLDD